MNNNNNNHNSNHAAAPIPVGFRFHPTDEELVGYYLHGKVGRAQRDQLIQELDLYKIEPWDLHELCRIGNDAAEDQSDWYFFSHKDKKYPTGNRANRATVAGFWKATGRDKPIYAQRHLLGMRKTLVFYLGRAPHGQKTDWIMHEFRLDSHAPGVSVPNYESEGWVVCRVFRKMKSFKTKSQEDTSCSFEEEQSQVVGPNQHHQQQQHQHQHQHHQHQPLSETTNFTGMQQLTAALSGTTADYYPHHAFNFTCKQENISVDDYGTPSHVAAMDPERDPELPAGPSSLISRQYCVQQQQQQSSRPKFHHNHNGFVSVEPANFDDARSSTTTVTFPSIHDDWILDGVGRDSMLQQRRDQTLADVTCHVHVKRQSASSDRLLVSHEGLVGGLVHLWNA